MSASWRGLGANTSRYLISNLTYESTELPRKWGRLCTMKRTFAARTKCGVRPGCRVRNVSAACSPVARLRHNSCALLVGVARWALLSVGVTRMMNVASVPAPRTVFFFACASLRLLLAPATEPALDDCIATDSSLGSLQAPGVWITGVTGTGAGCSCETGNGAVGPVCHTGSTPRRSI